HRQHLPVPDRGEGVPPRAGAGRARRRRARLQRGHRQLAHRGARRPARGGGARGGRLPHRPRRAAGGRRAARRGPDRRPRPLARADAALARARAGPGSAAALVRPGLPARRRGARPVLRRGRRLHHRPEDDRGGHAGVDRVGAGERVRVLGSPVRDRVPLGGGAARVRLADGRTVLVKDGDPKAVAAEAAGLRWLRVEGGPPVPEVLEVDGGRLVTEYVAAGSPDRRAAEELGRRLAAMHAAGAPAFGAPPPGGPTDARIRAAPTRNAPAPSWPEWYAADRVPPHLRTAR